MDRPANRGPRFNGGGFALAAILAPGLALAIFSIGQSLANPSIAPVNIGREIGSFLFLLLMVSFWGALPSLVFGGLVLAAIRRMPWRDRPTAAVFILGGVVAAGLYVLTGLGIAGLSSGVELLFAPWASPPFRASNLGDYWWVLTSLLLSGAGAGLIYAVFAKRG